MYCNLKKQKRNKNKLLKHKEVYIVPKQSPQPYLFPEKQNTKIISTVIRNYKRILLSDLTLP